MSVEDSGFPQETNDTTCVLSGQELGFLKRYALEHDRYVVWGKSERQVVESGWGFAMPAQDSGLA